MAKVRDKYLQMLSGVIETGSEWFKVDASKDIEEIHKLIWEKVIE